MEKAQIEIRPPEGDEQYARLTVVTNDRVVYSCLYDVRVPAAEEMALEWARQFMAGHNLEEQ